MTAQDPTHWMALFGPILISESAMVNARKANDVTVYEDYEVRL